MNAANRPEDILSAWTALEVLSPPSYVRPEQLAGGDRTRVAVLGKSALPWERGEKLRRNYRLYYQIVLGCIRMQPAVERLIERYGDTRPERPGVTGKVPLGILIVDHHGLLGKSPAIGISSFGWGVTCALTRKLADLAQWPQVEPQLIERIKKRLLDALDEGGSEDERPGRSVTRVALLAIYDELVSALGLQEEWVEPPEFAIRSYVYEKDLNPPEPLLLNSFFLSDLANARELFADGKAPSILRRYLGVDRPRDRRDLLRDEAVLKEAVTPGATPLARWPARGRHPLVLLQQAAVNLAFRETAQEGLIGINGPPGTGKTTLLRDIVAGVVTARAKAMLDFDDPATAFEDSGQKLKVGASSIHLYRLDAKIRGHEMLVASSNNKAVENVSAELPALGAVADDAQALRYFKILGDALHGRDTWGAIAAVLGNAQNRVRFKETFWWDDDNGLNSYLLTASGSEKTIEIRNPQTGQTQQRPPRIVDEEKPPRTRHEALQRWEVARTRFREAFDSSEQWQRWLESLSADFARLDGLLKAEVAAGQIHEVATTAARNMQGQVVGAAEAEKKSSRLLQDAIKALDLHGLQKPGLWARLIRSAPARHWSGRWAALHAQRKVAEAQHAQLLGALRRHELEARVASDKTKITQSEWEDARAKLQRTKDRLADATMTHGVLAADEVFFRKVHGARHQQTPWFASEAQRVRDEVFIAAMELHRAFIDAAARPLRHNLGALMSVFTTQTLPGAEKQALLPDLWASLFLVIPLLSTTFASVNRMLGQLPVEALGWLLVDEAGQALPQAAVGAIMRARRAVVVGDPVQIEPVVVLPDKLTAAICRSFDVEPDRYSAPGASVQTLADAASPYGSEFETNIGSRSVGVPLLVHRRCSEPMFGIANAIAYSGLMVFATPPRASAIERVLGPSRWIDVAGSGDDKWCQEEGDEVMLLLAQLALAGVAPDLYIITPFVVVADRLRQSIRESGVLRKWAIEDEWQWTNERIGTVHTAQGREAEAVILVLGAPLPEQIGARAWAGGRPNLLNVAVTRAKEVIYVVGNRTLWRTAGVFRELDRQLP